MNLRVQNLKKMKVFCKLKENTIITFGFFYLFLTMSTCAACIMSAKPVRKRRFGVRPMNRKRNSEGLFVTLIKDMINLEWDEEQFCRYTRMTKAQFSHLHKLIFPIIKKCRKKFHINTEQRLLMTLQ